MKDSIDRQDAIRIVDGIDTWQAGWRGNAIENMKALPSAQPERLTDDDFETIRIHLSAIKEQLGNQHRWKEARDYQRLIDRFMAFAEQPKIVRCKDCKHRPVTNDDYNDDEWDCGFNIEFPDYKCPCQCDDGYYNRLPDDNWFCANAERRTDGQTVSE